MAAENIGSDLTWLDQKTQLAEALGSRKRWELWGWEETEENMDYLLFMRKTKKNVQLEKKITSLRDNKRCINIYELLCAKLCSKNFMCMNSFNPHHKCTRGAQFSSHFTDEDAETQRGQVPWPRSHSQDMVKRTFPSLFLVLIQTSLMRTSLENCGAAGCTKRLAF